MEMKKDKDAFNELPMYSEATLKKRFEYLFNTELFADVHFIVGSGSAVTKYPAHKLVLSVGSTVFAAMFYGKLAESSDNIEVPDVEPDAFFELLHFLYLDSERVRINEENVESVMNAAVKYDVYKLRNHCVNFLIDSLSAENVFQILDYADFFSSVELKTACWHFIDWNTDKVLDTEDFNGLNVEILCSILERNTLHIREIQLFQAVIRWANAECNRKNLECVVRNQRFVAEKAIKLIRFSAMLMQDYVGQVSVSGVLTNDEELSILRHYTFPSKPKTMFIDEPRTICKVFKVNLFDHTTSYSPGSIIGKFTGEIRFAVNKEILFVGFAIYNREGGLDEHSVHITISETQANVKVATNETIITKDKSTLTFEVKFKIPVRILPNAQYMGQFSIAAPIYKYGYNNSGTNRSSSIVKTEIGDITFQFPNNNADSTLIFQLLFTI